MLWFLKRVSLFMGKTYFFLLNGFQIFINPADTIKLLDNAVMRLLTANHINASSHATIVLTSNFLYTPTPLTTIFPIIYLLSLFLIFQIFNLYISCCCCYI